MNFEIKGLSKMTKAKLKEAVLMIDSAYGELKSQFTLETERLENEIVSMRDFAAESQRLSEELVALKVELEEAKSANSEVLKLREKVAELESLVTELKNDLVDQEKQNSNSVETESSQPEIHKVSQLAISELHEKQILIDASYNIQWIGKDLLERMGNDQTENFSGRRIFELFDYKNGMGLKKRLDKVLVSGKSEKIKDLYIKADQQKMMKIKGKIKSAQFNQRPAAIIKLD